MKWQGDTAEKHDSEVRMNNFKIIYRILRYLEKAMEYDEVDMDFISAEKLGVSERRWEAVMEMLSNEGYVMGIAVKRSADGQICCLVSSPRITLKGLEYLQENSLMQKAASLAKGVVDIVS